MSLRKGHGRNPGSFTIWRRRATAFSRQYALVPTSLKAFASLCVGARGHVGAPLINACYSGRRWHMLVIPDSDCRGRKLLQVWSHPDLHSKFQAICGSIVRPYLEKPNRKKKKERENSSQTEWHMALISLLGMWRRRMKYSKLALDTQQVGSHTKSYHRRKRKVILTRQKPIFNCVKFYI